MKLISCHIENYGKISGEDFKFDGNLTAYCEKNGYGKTTLASFLKAMFYGLDSDRTNSGFNERRHYYPFAGGNFGGNVVFVSDGKTYKIERYFDEKSETKDSLTLYCNGKLTPADGVQPGQRFFGIDRQSFERTTFISFGDVEISSTGSINRKLNNFVEGGGDGNFEKAVLRVEEKKKEYKKRGGEGLIAAVNAKLNGLDEEIANKKEIARALAAKYDAFEENGKKLEAVRKRLEAARSENVVFANWDSYDRMTGENRNTRAKISEIEKRYPSGMPDSEQTERVKAALSESEKARARLSQKSFGEEDGARYAALSLKFANGTPTEDGISEICDCIEEEKKLGYELANCKNARLSDDDKKLLHRFSLRKPDGHELAELKEKERAYKEAEEEYAAMPDFSGGSPAVGGKKIFAILAAVSCLLLAGGAAAVFFVTAVGAVLLAAGGLSLIATGFFYLNKKAGAKAGAENPERASKKQQTAKLYDGIKAFILPYGYTLENGVPYAVETFLRDVKSFDELSEREKSRDEKERVLCARLEEVRKKIGAFFAKYEIYSANYADAITELRTEIKSFSDLGARKESWEKLAEELKEKIAAEDKKVRLFCDKYRLNFANAESEIKAIERDRGDMRALEEFLAAGEKNAEKFKEEKGLYSRPEGSAADMGALSAEEYALQQEKNRLFGEISDDEREAEKLSEYEGEYAETKALLAKYKADYELLEQISAALRKADAALKDRYIKPVKDAFLSYSDALGKALGEKITIGADFEVRFEQGGKERSERHLSFGQRTLCALCFRLALIDNMYTGEKPFVILDDPFASLDEEHLGKAKILLEELSENMQIIYFACHPSRALG